MKNSGDTQARFFREPGLFAALSSQPSAFSKSIHRKGRRVRKGIEKEDPGFSNPAAADVRALRLKARGDFCVLCVSFWTEC